MACVSVAYFNAIPFAASAATVALLVAPRGILVQQQLFHAPLFRQGCGKEAAVYLREVACRAADAKRASFQERVSEIGFTSGGMKKQIRLMDELEGETIARRTPLSLLVLVESSQLPLWGVPPQPVGAEGCPKTSARSWGVPPP